MPMAEHALPRDVVVMVFVVMAVMVVMVVMVVVLRLLEPRAEDARADNQDEQRGDQRQPRIEVLREEVLGQAERHEPQSEHADRVRDGDGDPECDRVARPALRPDEVGRNHGLPCPGDSAWGLPIRGPRAGEAPAPLSRGSIREEASEATLVRFALPGQHALAPPGRPGERLVAHLHLPGIRDRRR